VLKELLHTIWQKNIRTFAFISKEARSIYHQPRLIFTLILGPFLILLIFGAGYRNTARSLRTLFVVPEGSRIEALVEEFAVSLGDRITYAGITHDAGEADTLLQDREVDLVVLTPADPFADWENDEQSAFLLFHNEIDPLEEAYIQVMGRQYAEIVNEQVLLTAVENSQEEATNWQDDVSLAKDQASVMRQALETGNIALAQESAEDLQQDLNGLTMAVGSGLEIIRQLETATGGSNPVIEPLMSELASIEENTNEILSISASEAVISDGEATAAEIESSLAEADRLLAEFRGMESHILVSPFRSESINLNQTDLEPMHFYVPAVIALLLQHLAITLAGLSIVREKLEGAMELFRAGPVSAFEVLVGKYGSYIMIISLLAAILTALIVWGLGVPQLGSWAIYALILLGILLASLGIGFHISLSARSNDQAIQYAMIVLLAAIFFSGFFLPLYRLAPFVQVISWILPATYGTALLQDVMLRGQFPSIVQFGALYLFGIVLFLTAWWRLQRQMPRQQISLVPPERLT
jgi:ABC-2 type transport system permease protein